MSIIILLRDKAQLEVQGEEAEARRIMGSRRPVAVKAKKNGHVIIIRGRDVILAEVITAAEERANAEAARKAAEDAAKKNPNPGRDPRLVVPR